MILLYIMLNYLYNNLPIIKLLNKYSIWTLDDNENVIIEMTEKNKNIILKNPK